MPEMSAHTAKKNGKKRNRQSYICNYCGYYWLDFRGKKTNYKRHYHDYLFGRKTLENIADNLDISVDSLRKYFDKLEISSAPKPPPKEAICASWMPRFLGENMDIYLSTTRIRYFMLKR